MATIENPLAFAFEQAQRRSAAKEQRRHKAADRGNGSVFDPAIGRKNIADYRRKVSERGTMAVVAETVGEKFAQAVEDGITANHKIRRDIYRDWRPVRHAIQNGDLSEEDAKYILRKFAQKLDLPEPDGLVSRGQRDYFQHIGKERWVSDVRSIPYMTPDVMYFMIAFEQVSGFGHLERESYHLFIRKQVLFPFPEEMDITKLTARFLQSKS